jgi:hypothetical protein
MEDKAWVIDIVAIVLAMGRSAGSGRAIGTLDDQLHKF